MGGDWAARDVGSGAGLARHGDEAARLQVGRRQGGEVGGRFAIIARIVNRHGPRVLVSPLLRLVVIDSCPRPWSAFMGA